MRQRLIFHIVKLRKLQLKENLAKVTLLLSSGGWIPRCLLLCHPTKTLYARQQKRHRYKEQTFGLCGRRQGFLFDKMTLKHVYYHMWNRWPVQVRCMKLGTQSWCTGTAQRDGMGREVGGGSGWGTQVHPWLIHVNVWQNPLQYCKVISLQLK